MLLNTEIDIDRRYGLDRQEIKFTPNCTEKIKEGDVIVADNIELGCVGKDTFILYGDRVQFVKGIDLLSKSFKKLSIGITKVAEYFTPTIEEIRIGYECEINSRVVNGKDKWSPYTVGFDYENITIARALDEVRRKGIRTSYLTKEQIEVNLENTKIKHILDSERHTIKLFNSEKTFFYGQCKSVNELRQVLEYIKLLT